MRFVVHESVSLVSVKDMICKLNSAQYSIQLCAFSNLVRPLILCVAMFIPFSIENIGSFCIVCGGVVPSSCAMVCVLMVSLDIIIIVEVPFEFQSV